MTNETSCGIGWTPYKPGPSRQLGNNCISFSSSFFSLSSQSTSLHFTGNDHLKVSAAPKACCSEETPMQVDPTLMNVADGGAVKREICAPSKTSASMVGNPPQTLPPEFRGDVTLSQQNKSAQAKDCKTMKACVDSSNCNSSPDRSPAQQLSNAAASGPAVAGSEKRADKKAELPKLKPEGTGVFPTPQWSSGTKVSRDEPLKACHSNAASGKQAHPQTQPAQSVPPGFQCSAVFKPVQPVAFLPSANFSSSLCKITLPPALGDIAALRDAVANQCQKEIQPQSSGVRGAPLMRTYPYSFSVGRTPPAEKKTGISASKLKSNHSTNKNGKSAEQHKSLASVVASPAIALPLQHPTLTSAAPTCYTLSPTAAICCGSALASITSQSRLLNHAEKGNSTEKTPMSSFKAPPSAAEDHKVSSAEPRDVPLDLSAKSKRPKCINEPAVHNESNQRDFTTSKRTVAYSSAAGQYPVLPNTHRNGAQKPAIRPQNHQVSESKATRGKGLPQDPIKSIPGTYVGVASPILASTLRGKDGKGTFADEFQSFAKQEFISIIDQGEHLASGGKKPSCLMKGSQHAHSNKHVKNTSLSENCPTKGANTQIQKSGPGRAAHVNPAWQQLPNLPHQAGKNTQGSPNNKCTAATEGSKFAHHSPSKPEDDKWDRVKSPLSNLASIVKQQAIETSEVNAQSSPLTPKDDVLNPLTGSQDTQPKQPSVLKCPPYWSVEKRGAAPSQADSTQAAKRHEKANHAELVKNNTDLGTVQREHAGLQAKPAGHCHLFAGNASTNSNRKESKLAQVLEGDVLKAESGAPDSPPADKLEGMVASILAGQCAAGSDRFEKQTNGTKEESPTKAKAAAVKQRKTTSKPAKEKSPMGSLKKAAARKSDTEKTPITGSCQKEQKKQNASAAEQRRCAGPVAPQGKGSVPGDRTAPIKMEQNRNRADEGRRQQTAETPAFHSCSAAGETDASDSPFPRLRRGRRRADEARLDLWGFATPSPPTPPVPTPPSSPPPVLNSAQPARRPRGRPRSTPLPERASRGKDRTASEAETPAHVKRQRCRSRKYQTGEYITEKVKLEDGAHLEDSDPLRQHSETPAERQAAQCPSPKAPGSDPPPRRPSLTRSGSVRYHDSEVSPEGGDKPSGKRKFKSKHLCDNGDQKTSRRSGLGKRGASVALEDDSDAKRTASPSPAPKSLPSSLAGKRGSSGRSSNAESPPKKPIPPEVRRLIVNKNAGETLLQRAARLGYQDVVLYCLEKDVREVNRRDNAGYTALHEASSRGWTQIVQMLLKHGADVNCSAQDGTRPLHDAVASDNLPIVWLLLNHGADPTLATYSGQTPVKLAQSPTMKTFLTEYFTDLEGRKEQDPSLHWDFYSSSLFETDQEACWDFLLSDEGQEIQENDTGKTEDADKDCLVFELSSEPLLPCYHVQVSLAQGFCNWFLLMDVLKRLKMSARIFRARYPHLEVVSLLRTELWAQVSVSQVSTALASPHKGKKEEEEDEEEEEEEQEQEQELVELVRCVPELQRLLGSSIHILQEEEEEEEEEETQRKAGRARSR